MVSSFTACPRVLLFVRLYEAAVPAVSEAQRFTASRPGKRPKKLREEAAMAGIQEQLTSYLTDAHSIEEQALAQLRQAPSIAQVEGLSAAFRDHLAETEGHERAVAGLLEQRDASPSWFKDAVMKLGGKGFIFFAKANPDTPGKLLAHALSYEALEEASYRLLALVAEHGEDDEVVATAKRIGDEEVAMQRRLESHFDEAVAASLAAVEPDDLGEQLRRYLADAHAIEMQSIGLLERAATSDPGKLADAYEQHLVETREHAETLEARLNALGGDPSSLKDAAMRAGAINWAAFFEAHPDTPGKLAAFAYAFEHLEIGGYEQLQRVAARAEDDETVAVVQTILEQERDAAATLKAAFPEAARLALGPADARSRS
jgi:ferritin-like metal-binding protein YciE